VGVLNQGGAHLTADDLGRVVEHPQGALYLAAISCGAVFMGANTYIGNGPNFMVKAIAEHRGVAMPSFFAYMAWSLAVLIPLFVLVTLVFFRG
jgi:Na+/H+ antiporter NhaD/arsenite permease-like protein